MKSCFFCQNHYIKTDYLKSSFQRTRGGRFLYFKTIGAIITMGIVTNDLTGHARGTTAEQRQSKEKVKNVVMLLGDGMGPAAVTAMRTATAGPNGKSHLDSFPVSGWVSTSSSDKYATDSAASITAILSGKRTINGLIGMSDPRKSPNQKSIPLESVFELAKTQTGKQIGIVTNSRLSHATPAGVYAHVDNRDKECAIADQLVRANLDVALGGGRSFFFPPTWIDPVTREPGLRHDGSSLSALIESGEWNYITTRKQLLEANFDKQSKVLGLFAYDHLAYDRLRPEFEPNLTEMTKAALKRLQLAENGFFLLIESAKIDIAAHDNDRQNLLGELSRFNEVIGTVLTLVNLKDTLVIVTADHETGGIALGGDDHLINMNKDSLLNKKLDDHGQQHYSLSFASGPSNPLNKERKEEHAALLYRDAALHTAVDVLIASIGPGSEKFTGFMGNFEIAHRIAEVAGIKIPRSQQIDVAPSTAPHY